jgi:streptogramin lyase
MNAARSLRKAPFLALVSCAAVFAGFTGALLGACGSFTDVAADAFCPFVLEVFTLGVTTGTTATTYDPTGNVTRLQMAAFLSRGVDGVLRRGNRRTAMTQNWTTQGSINLGLTAVGSSPTAVQTDGFDLWVANQGDGTVSRVRAGDGRLLENWTGATDADAILVAMGKVFVTAQMTPGRLYRIDPSQPAGAVTTVASPLGNEVSAIGFDGARIWTANETSSSISIVSPTVSLPWTVTTITTGFSAPFGMLHDGGNIWLTDIGTNTLLKLDAAGGILQTVTVGSGPERPVFDGTNIWVPNAFDASVTVVRASNGVVLATLTGNGLNTSGAAAFDGQRVLVTNGSNTVSLWKAADLTPIGNFFTGNSTGPLGACSDGVNFWITLFSANKLARF